MFRGALPNVRNDSKTGVHLSCNTLFGKVRGNADRSGVQNLIRPWKIFAIHWQASEKGRVVYLRADKR